MARPDYLESSDIGENASPIGRDSSDNRWSWLWRSHSAPARAARTALGVVGIGAGMVLTPATALADVPPPTLQEAQFGQQSIVNGIEWCGRDRRGYLIGRDNGGAYVLNDHGTALPTAEPSTVGLAGVNGIRMWTDGDPNAMSALEMPVTASSHPTCRELAPAIPGYTAV